MKKYMFILASFFLVVTMLSLQSLKSELKEINAQDSLELDRQKYIKVLRENIKGKEKLMADSVFKNIKTLKGIPAGQLLAIMNMGYSKSLGVSCGHCHDTNKWDSDEKQPKLITREMASMSKRINTELLKDIPYLKNAVVNCTTCHRGQVKPALNLN